MARGNRSHRWRWWILSGVLSLVYLFPGGGKIARVQQHLARGLLRHVRAVVIPAQSTTRVFRMTEEWRMDVAPLVLFALVWLVADTAQPTDGQVRPR